MNLKKITFHGKKKPLQDIHMPSLKASLLKTIHQFPNKKLNALKYIIVDDETLLQINQDFLQHDYYTDIITFNLSDSTDNIEGEIYISADRVIENAKTHNTGGNEILRVVFHGLLHLLGLNDSTAAEQKEMRRMEEQCITLYLQTKAN